MKSANPLWRIAGLTCLCLLSACSQATPEPAATPSPSSTPVPTATDTASPAPTNTPTVTPTPGPMSAEEVFDLLSPSIAFLETPIASGSGVLIADNYVLTNAHVVWPYDQARVVFSDGSEFEEAPVIAWDLMADLALLGPVDTGLPALELVDGEGEAIGRDVYLIGYPGEVDEFPQPTFSRGLISRQREWEELELTYLQTDAAIAGGQSGGVLVSDRGKVIGISGLRFTEVSYGIILSAADILPRLEPLRDGASPSELGERQLLDGEAALSHRFLLEPAESVLFVSQLNGDQSLELTLKGAEGIDYQVIDPSGLPLIFQTTAEQANEEVTVEARLDGPHFVALENRGQENSYLTLEANRSLALYEDVDDDHLVRVGSTYYGAMDYAGDVDRYQVLLNEGDIINVRVESALIDPAVRVIDFAAGPNQEAFDDDSGSGLFGLSAALSYFAPHAGLYGLEVSDSFSQVGGGYTIAIAEWAPADPTPIVPLSTPTPIVTESGEVVVYQSPNHPFTIQAPADWFTDPEAAEGQLSFFCLAIQPCYLAPEANIALGITEEDLSAAGLEDMSTSEYGDLVEEVIGRSDPDAAFTGETLQTDSGLTVEVLSFSLSFGGYGSRMYYVHEGVAFNASFLAADQAVYDQHAELIGAVYVSFDVTE